MPSIQWRDLVMVFLVALAIRVGYLIEASADPAFDLLYMDEEYNVTWARCLSTGHWVGPYEALRDGPYFRAPLYSHFLAGVFSLLGPGLGAARVVQIILGSLSCAVVCLLGSVACSRGVGLLAGLVCATAWVLVYFDAEFLLPVLLVFLATSGLLLALIAAERRSVVLVAASGTVFGLYAITRPNILAFLPFCLGWVWWASGRGGGRGWMVTATAVGFLVPPAAVTVRNGLVGGDWVVIASQGGVNFYIGNNERSNGMEAVVPGTRHTWWGGYDDTVREAERDTGSPLKPSQVSGYWFRRGLTFIRHHPGRWARLTVRKIGALVGSVEIPNNEPYEARRHRYVSLRIFPVGFGMLLAASLIGIPLAWRHTHGTGATDRRCRRFLVLLLMFAVSYGASVVAFFVTGRYRVPLIPVVAVGAAMAMTSFWNLLRMNRIVHASFLGAAVAVLAFGFSRDYLGVRRATTDFAVFSDAQDALSLGRPTQAVEMIEGVAARGRFDVPELYRTMAQAYIARNAPGDGRRVLETALQGLDRHPDEPELLWYAAVGLTSRREWGRADTYLSRYMNHRPDDLRALLLAFRCAIGEGDMRRAAAIKARAAAIDPAHPAVQAMEFLASTDTTSSPGSSAP